MYSRTAESSKAVSRFRFRNALHCNCLVASLAKASLRPIGVVSGSAVCRRENVASMARRSSLPSKVSSYQVDVLLRRIRVLLQSRTDGSGAVGGHAVIASM